MLYGALPGTGVITQPITIHGGLITGTLITGTIITGTIIIMLITVRGITIAIQGTTTIIIAVYELIRRPWLSISITGITGVPIPVPI